MSDDLIPMVEMAKLASKKAYAPYSKFPVGCVIRTIEGNSYTGCNVENISFGLTICAERSAISKAISEEGPDLEIDRVIIYTPTNVPITPCGACRQVLREFGDNFEIICFCDDNDEIRLTIDDLLPRSPDIRIKS